MRNWLVLGVMTLTVSCCSSPTTSEPTTAMPSTPSSAVDSTTTAAEPSRTASDTTATPTTEGGSKRLFVSGYAMEPTLADGDLMTVDTNAYDGPSPMLADIVVFRVEENGLERMLVKRVVGLPDQMLSIESCVVTIDGAALEESYLKPDEFCGDDIAAVAIPGDSVYVMGDNRCCSRDSRGFGPIPLGDIIGKVVAATAPDGTPRHL